MFIKKRLPLAMIDEKGSICQKKNEGKDLS